MSHRLQVLIPEQLDDRLRKAAARDRVSKGEWVRRALLRVLDGDARRADPVRALAALEAPTGDIEHMLDEIDAGRR